jgi:hypothetical protein
MNNHTRIGVGLLVLLLSGLPQWVRADIDISEDASIVRLDAKDEALADILSALAERFNFNIQGEPKHWSGKAEDFQASGELEDVLSSLLKDTSHVFAYHTDPQTRTTRIAALKLLNRGVAGFASNPVPNTPIHTSAPPAADGWQHDGAIGADGLALSDAELADLRPDYDADVTSKPARRNTSTGPQSQLSQSLEQRARLTVGSTAGATNLAGNTSGGVASAPRAGQANPDMQALTQKALQGVQDLAKALRQAEQGNN